MNKQALIHLVTLIFLAPLTLFASTSADAVKAEYALVIPTRIKPTAEAFQILHVTPVEVPWSLCDPAAAENEATKATAAMRATEAAEALALELADWTPTSRATCVRKTWEILYRPKLPVIEQQTCLVIWTEALDWSTAWAGCP